MISRSSMSNQMWGNKMPLTKKGEKIMDAMKSEYGAKRGESVFYASKNKGRIEGVEKKANGGDVGKSREEKALETIGAIRRGAGGIPVYVAEGNVDVGIKKKASGGMINNRGDGMASRGFTRGRMC
jgi:hypothetical protein